MINIIQTNTIINKDNKELDFQSIYYTVCNKTWEEFKFYILHPELHKKYNMIIKNSTMMMTSENIMLKDSKIKDILINDDFHLEVNVVKEYKEAGILSITNKKFYMV